MKLPTVKDLRTLLIDLKGEIGDEYRGSSYEAPGGPDDGPPSMDVTIGWTPETGSWSYQTGDNSYTGGAYGHPYWAVIELDRRSNSTELARDIRNQLADQFCQ
jgi:hypothetical protein